MKLDIVVDMVWSHIFWWNYGFDWIGHFSCFWMTAHAATSCIGVVKYVAIQPFTHWKCCFQFVGKKIQTVAVNTAEGANSHTSPHFCGFFVSCIFSVIVVPPPTEPTVLWWTTVHTHTHTPCLFNGRIETLEFFFRIKEKPVKRAIC